MATVLSTLNRVLRVLDPTDQIADGTSELTEDYHLLILNFLNTIKEEVEDAHQWRSLRTAHAATITASAVSGVITNATERSRLVRLYQSETDRIVPLVYDITDATNPDHLIEIDLSELLHRYNMDPDETASDSPTFFALDNSAGDGQSIYVWPAPTTERTLRIYMTTPQTEYAADDLATVISVPSRPIEVGTLWYALEERGEELGTQGLFNEQRYLLSLQDAISRDSAEAGDAFELVRS